VKPEAAAFLDKANQCLAKADGMVGNWPDEAGRAAYLAGLHAAQALIVERSGSVIKSHKGVQRELARLTKDTPDLSRSLTAFLGRTYNLKAIADYESGPDSEVSQDSAEEAIKEAKHFVAKIIEMIGVA
jgi:uncharacterized protein (UPF0332 family)